MQHAMHCYHFYADQHEVAELASYEFPRAYQRICDQMEYYLVNSEPPIWEDTVDRINDDLIKTNNRFIRQTPDEAT